MAADPAGPGLSRRAFLAGALVVAVAPAGAAVLPAPAGLALVGSGPIWIKPFPQDLFMFAFGVPKRVDITQYVTGAKFITLNGPALPTGVTFDGTAISYDGKGQMSGLISGFVLVADDGVI